MTQIMQEVKHFLKVFLEIKMCVGITKHELRQFHKDAAADAAISTQFISQKQGIDTILSRRQKELIERNKKF